MVGFPRIHDARRTKKFAALCLLLLSTCAIPARATAEGPIASPEPGWPQWRGPRRDGVCDEKGLLASWPQDGPTLLWKIDGLGKGWSSPIVVGERIYITGDVGDDLIAYALDLDGAIQWQVKNGRSWKTPYGGARACCAYSEDRVYNLNAHGRLACLDAASGREQWAVHILERFQGKNITWALSECLLVDGERVIVTPGGRRALMAALDKHTGETLWTTEPLEDDLASHSSPILFLWGGRRIIANCSSAHGFGVDADTGKLLWTVPLKNPHGVNTSTPIYGSGSVFFVTPYSEYGRLYRLASNDQGMAAAHVWTSPIDTVTGCGVLVDGILFASGYRDAKWWLGIDWQTGRTKCELRDLTTGAAIWADQRLYVLDERGMVALLKPGPDSMEIAGQFRLTNDEVRDAWAHPVLLNGRLYLRYHDTLWCYDVKQRP
ncbi:MAG TPA: PQQ-like beta-propeller repeat protein [Sedimentisphaerales bacterium]|jgi:outer membrane protein assembly factor BamB|nr:PQQ-like beta-propeller repeat protein [Sedimentisphaerales bacterium]HNU29119.1 PQQ-like beta-propeller repeat protein [Sedimentisphaerales bacterium]